MTQLLAKLSIGLGLLVLMACGAGSVPPDLGGHTSWEKDPIVPDDVPTTYVDPEAFIEPVESPATEPADDRSLPPGPSIRYDPVNGYEMVEPKPPGDGLEEDDDDAPICGHGCSVSPYDWVG